MNRKTLYFALLIVATIPFALVAAAEIIIPERMALVRAEKAARAVEASNEKRIKTGSTIILALLRDPGKARLGRVFVGREDAVCGYIRSPGLPPSTFIVANDWMAINDLGLWFENNWKRYCHGGGK